MQKVCEFGATGASRNQGARKIYVQNTDRRNTALKRQGTLKDFK